MRNIFLLSLLVIAEPAIAQEVTTKTDAERVAACAGVLAGHPSQSACLSLGVSPDELKRMLDKIPIKIARELVAESNELTVATRTATEKSQELTRDERALRSEQSAGTISNGEVQERTATLNTRQDANVEGYAARQKQHAAWVKRVQDAYQASQVRQAATVSLPPAPSPAIADDVEATVFHDGSGFRTRLTIGNLKTVGLIDTGASALSFCSDTLEKSGLTIPKEAPRGKATIADGSKIETRTIIVPRIEFAGLVLTNVRAAVNSAAKSCTILIGLTALSRLKSVVLDGETLVLRGVNSEPAQNH